MDQFLQSLESADPRKCSNDAERIKVTNALFAALRRFQQSSDIVLEHSCESSITHAATKTLIDAGVFHKWAESGGGTKSSAELAQLTSTDPVLIKRLVRHLAAQHLLIEAGEDAYQPTPWSTAMGTDPLFSSWYGAGFYYDLVLPTFNQLPAFLSSTGFRNPTDGSAGSFQHIRGRSDTEFWEYAHTRPQVGKELNDAMEFHSRHYLLPWVDIYPTDTVIAAARSGRALVVDVGGGKGHDLEKFRLRHQGSEAMSTGGVLVLQDKPEVVARGLAGLDDAIEVQAHDVFTPQPVRGARLYLLHNVVHDWQDDDVVRILAHIADAMEKGYSRLLIHEYVISAVRPHNRVTTHDLVMMATVSSKERTEAEFEELVNRAGLRVCKIWRLPHGVDGIIEAELA